MLLTMFLTCFLALAAATTAPAGSTTTAPG
jgi:hypothetical protein